MLGYEQIKGNKFVPAEDALDHVLKECGLAIVNPAAPDAKESQEMLVEWYFSGNWVEVKER